MLDLSENSRFMRVFSRTIMWLAKFCVLAYLSFVFCFILESQNSAQGGIVHNMYYYLVEFPLP